MMMSLMEEELLRECIHDMQDERVGHYHKFKNGYISTSKNLPESGNIFLYIKDGPLIHFEDSTYRKHDGIISAINYNIVSGKYSFSVFTYEYLIMGEEKEIKKYTVSTSYLPNYRFDKFV